MTSIDILEIENENELINYNPSCRADVVQTMARGFTRTLNRWLFAGNRIAFDTLKNLSPKTISECEIYGLVFGPRVATNLINLPDWKDFLIDYLASEFPVNNKITLPIFFKIIEIAFLTERGREWLSYQDIKFTLKRGNEIGHCISRINVDEHKILILRAIEHDIFYDISQYPVLFIKAYEVRQNEALIEQNMAFVIACCASYFHLENKCFRLLEKIVTHLSVKQLLFIFNNGNDKHIEIVRPYIDWSRAYWSPLFPFIARTNPPKVPFDYLNQMIFDIGHESKEQTLYSFLSRGWPSIRLPDNFGNIEMYLNAISSSPRIRALLKLTDTGTFVVEDYRYLCVTIQRQIRTCLMLKQMPDNMMSALPIELAFLLFFYL